MNDIPKRYGKWAGCPNGKPESAERCRAEVYPIGRSFVTYQCQRKRGHGIDGAFCSQHAKSSADIKPMHKNDIAPNPPKKGV